MGVGTTEARRLWLAGIVKTMSLKTSANVAGCARLPAGIRADSIEAVLLHLSRYGFIVVAVDGLKDAFAVYRGESIRTGTGVDLETTIEQDYASAC